MEMEETENGERHGCPADLISALPEDLLLQVLKRLGCARDAARTSLLSRRWRSIWTRLPKVTIVLRDVPFRSIEAALARAAARAGVCHYHLDIRVPPQAETLPAASISALLDAAAALSPVEMLFAPQNLQVFPVVVDLPRFSRATVIDLRARHLHFCQPSGFPSLERLSLSGCDVDLAALIPRCPRIRVLRMNNNNDGWMSMHSITIHSASLEELSVESGNIWISCIDVNAPVLKQLNLTFHGRGDLRVSVLAPMAEKVSWRCTYTRPMYRLGLWGLSEVGLNTIERPGQLPGVQNVLSLHMAAQGSFRFLNAEPAFGADIKKHMVTEFSGLDLHLRTSGHVFGALVLRLFGMHRIHRAIRNLRIVLLRSEVKEACPVNCLCDEPKDWRTQTISLADLETVEIEGVDGEDHESDFLKVIFACAPMLKRVTLRLAYGVTPCVDWCTKVNNIVQTYPLVKCKVDLVSKLV